MERTQPLVRVLLRRRFWWAMPPRVFLTEETVMDLMMRRDLFKGAAVALGTIRKSRAAGMVSPQWLN